MAERLRGVIKEKFGTQIALARAIGVKDGSYLTPYVTGRSMIGGILRKKLEGVGIDVDYVMTGRRASAMPGEESASPSDNGPPVSSSGSLMDVESKLLELNVAVLELGKMMASLKKSLE